MSTITINGASYSRFLHYPYNYQLTLNETLDTAVVTLSNMTKKAPFRPFSRVFLDGRAFTLAVDETTEIIGRNAYNHTLTLIEPTKLLERYIVGGKKFTNPVNKQYKTGRVYGREYTTVGGQAIQKLIRPTMNISPRTIGNVTIPSLKQAMRTEDNDSDLIGIGLYYSQREIGFDMIRASASFEQSLSGLYEFSYIARESTIGVPLSSTQPFTMTLSKTGIYKVVYFMDELFPMEPTGSFDSCSKFYEFDIVVYESMTNSDTYTVKKVIETLLETVKPLRVDEDNETIDEPSFVLNTQNKAEFYSNAPEFMFAPGRSLWECLAQIGEYIHGIPRLGADFKTITFDTLGGTEKVDFSKGRKIANSESYGADDYTETLTATFSNMVDQDDASGIISDPAPHLWKTLRTSSESSRIQEGSSYITTAFPIQMLKKLEVMVYDGTSYSNPIDITQYVFEKSEYDTLSNTSYMFPYAKSYALYYTSGQQNIDGLWFKAEVGTNIEKLFNRYAIVNILNAERNREDENEKDQSGAAYTKRFIDSFMFRVTYVPIVDGMINAKKKAFDGNLPLALVFNQSANKMSAKAFGEALRGRLEMLATTERKMTYLHKNASNVQAPGKVSDGLEYIGAVTVQVNRDYVIAEYTIATGYNKLGAFVNVDNDFRMFEIPEETDRYIILEDYCNITQQTATASDDTPLAGDNMKTILANSLKSSAQSDYRIADSMMMHTYKEDGTEITDGAVMIPCLTIGTGTSMTAIMQAQNNVSAGSKAIYLEDTTKRYDFQSDVQIADEKGRAKYLEFKLCTTLNDAEGPMIESAQDYPKKGITVTTGYEYASGRLLFDKDAGDNLRMAYQLHFISDDGIIIGSDLARRLLLCEASKGASSLTLLYYSFEINELTGATPRNAIPVDGFNIDTVALRSGIIQIDDPTSDTNPVHKSWALYLTRDGETSFILGKNTTEKFSTISMNIMHNR